MRASVPERTREMLALAQQGDSAALNRLCVAYAERIRRIVRLRMGPQLRAQLESMDLVQEALLAAVRGLDDLTCHDEDEFMGWLVRVVENRIRDHADRVHARKRDIRKEISLDGAAVTSDGGARMPAGLPVITTTPSAILAHNEDLNRLERAVDRLSEEHRQVILWAKIEGLSYRQIGERLDKSPEAVGMLLSRAMVALAKAFERS